MRTANKPKGLLFRIMHLEVCKYSIGIFTWKFTAYTSAAPKSTHVIELRCTKEYIFKLGYKL